MSINSSSTTSSPTNSVVALPEDPWAPPIDPIPIIQLRAPFMVSEFLERCESASLRPSEVQRFIRDTGTMLRELSLYADSVADAVNFVSFYFHF